MSCFKGTATCRLRRPVGHQRAIREQHPDELIANAATQTELIGQGTYGPHSQGAGAAGDKMCAGLGWTQHVCKTIQDVAVVRAVRGPTPVPSPPAFHQGCGRQ